MLISPPATSQIELSIPRNTAVPGAVVTRIMRKVPYDISWEDFRARICAHMDLDPQHARLGYKLPNSRVRDPPQELSDEFDLRGDLDTTARVMQCARTRKVTLELHKLVSLTIFVACSSLMRFNRVRL